MNPRLALAKRPILVTVRGGPGSIAILARAQSRG